MEPKRKTSNEVSDNPALNLIAGMVSGLFIAGVFNPWDRALYLSVKEQRPFLDRRNFKRPFQGFFQSMFHRTLSGGIYFPLYDIFENPCLNYFPESSEVNTIFARALAGNLAGASSGTMLNSLTTIKYTAWYHDLSIHHV
jgi:hypothetical protein